MMPIRFTKKIQNKHHGHKIRHHFPKSPRNTRIHGTNNGNRNLTDGGYIRMKDGSSVSIPHQHQETVLDKLTGKTAGYKNSIRISCARITRTNIDNGYTVA